MDHTYASSGAPAPAPFPAASIAEGPTGLAGCCYRKLARLIPDLTDLVDHPPGHSRESTVTAGATLKLFVLGIDDCLRHVDIGLAVPAHQNGLGLDVRTMTIARVHFAAESGYVEPLMVPAYPDLEASPGEPWAEMLTRGLSHWLKYWLCAGHRLGPLDSPGRQACAII